MAFKVVTFCLLLFAIFCALFTVCLFRTLFTFRSPKPEPCGSNHKQIVADQNVLKRFSDAIKLRTISWEKGVYERDELAKFAALIKNSFPNIHSSKFITHEIVNNYSMLYTIKGSDSSLKPYLLLAHLDVVPVEVNKWIFPPFEGTIKDGYIYGRGSIDVKFSVMSIMEALEYLLKNGFKPKRSFYISFGHDEEVLGADGARMVANKLKIKGVGELEYLLDEGSPVLKNIILGVNTLVAMVSTTEKGYATVRITVKGEPGHSSFPPFNLAVNKLAKIIAKFTPNAHRNMFGYGIEMDLLESIAPYASFPYKFVYSNLWLFEHILAYIFTLKPLTNSFIRTSTTIVKVNAGIKENVVPSEAEAVINHRINPSQSVKEIFEYDKYLAKDENVTIQLLDGYFEPLSISPTKDTFGFEKISKSIKEIFGDIPVVPGILIGNTDSRWYRNLTNCIYRFLPVVLTEDDLKGVHGHNERLSVSNYENSINFYHHLILNSNEKHILQKKKIKSEL
ncbi:putative carboxypeptidase PM20D1-like protein [Dinothrombium tinctorium]|uniref:Putative carboxypeptidase PM20D1-like protein n=1 Tax=Dinothrombium tinctorium TaxID=1965070 RepID=A0A3S3PEZ7_9ACAR|nr:putative carboxypeptidase PM20D1-like protein [Dinothrombium tinctorium]